MNTSVCRSTWAEDEEHGVDGLDGSVKLTEGIILELGEVGDTSGESVTISSSPKFSCSVGSFL